MKLFLFLLSIGLVTPSLWGEPHADLPNRPVDADAVGMPPMLSSRPLREDELKALSGAVSELGAKFFTQREAATRKLQSLGQVNFAVARFLETRLTEETAKASPDREIQRRLTALLLALFPTYSPLQLELYVHRQLKKSPEIEGLRDTLDAILDGLTREQTKRLAELEAERTSLMETKPFPDEQKLARNFHERKSLYEAGARAAKLNAKARGDELEMTSPGTPNRTFTLRLQSRSLDEFIAERVTCEPQTVLPEAFRLEGKVLFATQFPPITVEHKLQFDSRSRDYLLFRSLQSETGGVGSPDPLATPSVYLDKALAKITGEKIEFFPLPAEPKLLPGSLQKERAVKSRRLGN